MLDSMSPELCGRAGPATGCSCSAGASGCEAGHPSWEASVNDRILWGQIAAVFLIVLLAVWGATQWTAAALAFQPELGEPWFLVGDYPVYLPPAFFWWWFAFDRSEEHTSELQSLMRISYAVFCLKKKKRMTEQ